MIIQKYFEKMERRQSRSKNELMLTVLKFGKLEEPPSFEDCSSNLRVINQSDLNPIYIAYKVRNSKIVKHFMRRGVEIDVKKNSQSIPETSDQVNETLEYILETGEEENPRKNDALAKCLNIAVARDLQEIVELFVRKGMFPIQDKETNDRVFRYVVEKSDEKIVEIVLRKMEDSNWLDTSKTEIEKNELCSLQEATDKNHNEMMQLLLDFGDKAELANPSEMICGAGSIPVKQEIDVDILQDEKLTPIYENVPYFAKTSL